MIKFFTSFLGYCESVRVFKIEVLHDFCASGCHGYIINDFLMNKCKNEVIAQSVVRESDILGYF